MPLYPLRQAPGLGGGERLVETGRAVRVEVVQDQHDLLGLGELLVHQRHDDLSEVLAGAAVGHFDVPPAQERRGHHEQAGLAAPRVLTVLTERLPWRERQGRADIG